MTQRRENRLGRSPRSNKRAKTKDKVRNWHQSNETLRNRGLALLD